MTIERLWQQIQAWLAQRPFGGDVSVLHMLIGLFVGYLLLVVIRKTIFSRLDKPARALKPMACTSCGWEGQLQVTIRQCPHCGQHTMARRP